MIVQTTALGNPIVDTHGELYGFTLQNNDPANDVYVSSARQGLDKSGVGVAPLQGIRIAANGGSWTVMFFSGKLYAVAMNAPVNLIVETWCLHGTFMSLVKKVVDTLGPAQKADKAAA